LDEEILLRRLERERQARKQAEHLLEEKSLALYRANQKLAENTLELEKKFRKSTLQLEISEIRNRAILHSALDAIVTIDIEGKVLEFNPAASALFGYKPEEIIGKSMAEYLIPQRFREQHEQGMQHYRKTGKGDVLNRLVELTAVDRAGDEKPVEAAIIPVELAGSRFFTAFMRDISSRKQFEELIVEAKEAAESASRAKSDFLAVMSHEIRTPINAILGAVTLLGELDHNEEQSRYLKMADEASKSLLSLINDILDFSKIEAGKLELEPAEFDLVELVEETLGLFSKRAHELGLDLSSFFSAHVPRRITSDQGKIRQIILNLLSNALKFTEQGGILIRIETEDDGLIRFQVTDTGIGIEETKITTLFDQFVQADSSTKRKYGGTGLGLAISCRLAALLGGDMGVQTIKEVGSQFWFTIKPGSSSEIHCIKKTAHKATLVKLYETNLITLCALTRQLSAMGLEVEIHSPGKDGQSRIEFSNDQESWQYNLTEQVSNRIMADSLVKPVKLDDLYMALDHQLNTTVQTKHAGVPEIRRQQHQRLLLAEDSQANQIIAKTFLENAGYDVDVVADGQEAVNAVMALPYDLILMDVSMPEMDGLEATRRIRELPDEKGQINIIALTANVFKDDLDRCMEAGMNGFIPKPIDKNRLLSTLEHYLPTPPLEDATTSTPEIAKDTRCLDQNILDQLINDVGEEVLPTMLEVYFKEVDNRCKQIKQAMTALDIETMREQAHALKSSSGALGAANLRDIAEKIEYACKQGHDAEAKEIAGRLEDVANDCIRALSHHFHQVLPEKDE
jgi:PAS domain S-box-containing protein